MKIKNIKEIFHSFVGTWNIKRMIGTEPIGEGKAVFVLKDHENIAYREDIKIKYPNSPMIHQAYKEYLYKYHSHEDEISKNFINDKIFYYLKFTNNKQSANGLHLCNKDHYKAIYNFLTKNYFQISYEVHGEGKNYVISTEFTKIDGSNHSDI